MKLQATSRLPERILTVGSGGAGKTRAMIDIAKRCLADGQRMFVIDTENALPVLLEAEGMWMGEEWQADGEKLERVSEMEEDGGQIVRYWPDGWMTERAALDDALGRAGAGDWVCVDSMTHLWADVQAWYMGKVTGGKDMSDWLVDTIQQGRESGRRDDGAGEMLREWRPINSQWAEHVRRPFAKAGKPGGPHLYLTAHAKAINPEHDSADLKLMWGRAKMKADCQKGLGHDVRTVLALELARVGNKAVRKVTTVKDWGKDEEDMLLHADFSSLPVTYLKGVAGWAMVK